MNDLALDREWDAGALLRFALPTMAMMIFMGLYTLTDTVFVARFVHLDALSALNIVCPVVNLSVGLGTMLATGGNAIISREMGAGNIRQAREALTMLTAAGGLIGLLLLIGGTLWIDAMIHALGAGEALFPYCKDYLSVLLLFAPANILQTLFSNLFVTAGKPGLGLGLSLAAGMGNLILDYIFIVPCGLGIQGAALGTGVGYLIPTLGGLLYFSKGGGALAFTRSRGGRGVLLESCLNGSSEMVSQLAVAVTTFLFNAAMMERLGKEGVAALTVILYFQFMLKTLFIGFSIGVAPVFGFHHGSQNHGRQKRVFHICLGFLSAASLGIFAVSRMGGADMVSIFTDSGSRVYPIAVRGFRIFSYSILFCGFNDFTSAMFTALSNGKLSAALSFLRTFGLLAGGILLFSKLWGVSGIWLSIPVAEGIQFLISVVCLIQYRKKYFYG